MSKEDVVDAPDGIDLVGDVNRDWDSDDKSEQDEEVEDEENQEREQEEEEEDENEEEDHDDDYGKEPQTIGQGEMVNSSAHNVDTIEDNQPTVFPEQG
jgi:hypothetical protein